MLPRASTKRARERWVDEPVGGASKRSKKVRCQTLADARQRGTAETLARYKPLVESTPGRTLELCKKMGWRFLARMLRRWSVKTLTGHFYAIRGFERWLKGRWPEVPLAPVTLQTNPEEGEFALVQILGDFIMESFENNWAKSRVSSAFAGLRFLGKISGAKTQWPTNSSELTLANQAKVRVTGKKPRKKTVYSVEEVRCLEKAARTHPKPLGRIVARNELRKIYGVLRNDDAVWDPPPPPAPGKAPGWSNSTSPGKV